MFGKLRIRPPSGGEGKVCSGQVTLLRTRSDDVRVVLSTLSPRESQAFIATARSSTSLGFSVDIVRANEREPWGDGQTITVNWFAWSSDIEKSLVNERRGSLPLSNATTRVSVSDYVISFQKPLSRVPRAIVASARNENRAQVLAVNVIGEPTVNSFTVRVKRLDEEDAIIEEEGTFVDWIAIFGDESTTDPAETNRTGQGLKFSSPFQTLSSDSQKVFVIHTIAVPDADDADPVFANSVTTQNLKGFSISKTIPLKSTKKRASEEGVGTIEIPPISTLGGATVDRPARLNTKINFVAWEGITDECEWDTACLQRGSCVYSTSTSLDPYAIPQSTCACRSPYAGFSCEEECPFDVGTGLVCSGNGICNQLFPQCECFSGWTGDFCSAKALSADSRFVFLVSIGIVVFFSSLFGYWIASKCRRRRSRERRLLDLRRALLGGDVENDAVPRERYEQMDVALNGEARNWAIPFEKLAIGAQIGHGSSSQVFVGLWANQTVAIKKIAVSRKQQHDKSLKTDTSAQDVWLYFKREAGFLSTLHHPNIVRFFGVASQQDYRIHGVIDYFYIVTELCSASLSDLIRGPVLRRPPKTLAETSIMAHSSPNSSFVSGFNHTTTNNHNMGLSSGSVGIHILEGPEDEKMAEFVLNILKQICLGMDFLHAKGVVHRDLKCDNVLLDAQNRVKLCDFGISRVVDRSKGFIEGQTAMIATPAFMAPELIMTGMYPCGTKSDVFSFGIVVWSLLMWQEPYADLQASHSVFELLSQITMHGLRPSVDKGTWPPVLVEWYHRMVEGDPDRRPSFNELLEALDGELGNNVRAAWAGTVVRTFQKNSASFA